MNQGDDLIFHARRGPVSIKRTHTLCVSHMGNELLVVWSKPHPGNEKIRGDCYSRYAGRQLCLNKMEKFKKELAADTIIRYDFEDLNKKELFNHIPACVALTLPWYLKMAGRYFKIGDSQACNVVLRAARKNSPIQHHALSFPLEKFFNLCEDREPFAEEAREQLQCKRLSKIAGNILSTLEIKDTERNRENILSAIYEATSIEGNYS